MELQQKIDRITDILRRDDGISGAMHYTEQISWILFLKFLNDFEEEKEGEALLNNTKYERIITNEFQWIHWACPKSSENKPDFKNAKTGDDLTKFVNSKLFPYLKGFKANTNELKSVKYKIGNVFEFLDNRIASGHTLREVLDIIDTLNFQSQEELFELSHVYENLLQGMGNDGGNSGEFYTPRAVIKAVIEAIQPEPGQTIYDGAAGSCGFLIEAFEYIKEKYRNRLSTQQWQVLHEDTFFGNEKTPLAYIMGVMNMILHGIESPNLYKQNTLTNNIRDIQEKDRYDIIVANPPFGGKEKPQIQQNFPIQANATELLFLQHFMKSLKKGGKAAIVIPEGVLFQTVNSFRSVKEELLSNFNIHTILSLPAGVFLPYSGVKTNVLFFDRTGATSEIWYYECNPEQKLTKNKPIQYEHLKEFVELFPKRSLSQNSWLVKVNDIVDTDLSAKNPNISADLEHLPPKEIFEKIKNDESEYTQILYDIEAFLHNSLSKHKYETYQLKNITHNIQYGYTGKTTEIGQYYYLRITDIQNGKVDFTQTPFSDIPDSIVDKYILSKGDILFARSGATAGKTYLFLDDKNSVFASYLIRVVCNRDMIIPNYLYWYFQTKDYWAQIQENIVGAAQPNFNGSKLGEIKVPVPSLETQKILISQLEKMSSLFSRIQSIEELKLKYLKVLNSALLDLTIKGEL